jgi:hypothetical protein
MVGWQPLGDNTLNPGPQPKSRTKGWLGPGERARKSVAPILHMQPWGEENILFFVSLSRYASQVLASTLFVSP